MCLSISVLTGHDSYLLLMSYGNHKIGVPLPVSPAGLDAVGVLWACLVDQILHKLYISRCCFVTNRVCRRQWWELYFDLDSHKTAWISCWSRSGTQACWFSTCHPKYYASASCLTSISFFLALKLYSDGIASAWRYPRKAHSLTCLL